MTLSALASLVVLLAGLYLLLLGLACLAARPKATAFLQRFAGSARAHYLEMAVRLVVGAAFVLAAPGMAGPRVFAVVGWVLVATTVPLLLMPWRWHHRLARRIVPPFLRLLPLVGACSVLAGLAVVGALLQGPAA